MKKKILFVIVFLLLLVIMLTYIYLFVRNHNSANPDNAESYLDVPAQVTEDDIDEPSDGDIAFETDFSEKFVNWDTFVVEFPNNRLNKLQKSIPKDILEIYPDLTFVSYDSVTDCIECVSESTNTTVTFTYNDEMDVYSLKTEMN